MTKNDRLPKMQTQTLEPRIESSLLYTRGDGRHEFVHDSYKDFFLAKYLAEETNSGRGGMEIATIGFAYLYQNYRRHATECAIKMLDNNKIQELVNVTSQNFVGQNGVDLGGLRTKIEVLTLLAIEEVVSISFFSEKLLEVARQIFKEFSEYKINKIDYILLEDVLYDVVYYFRAAGKIPSKESFLIGRLIAKEVEYAPERLKPYYIKLIDISGYKEADPILRSIIDKYRGKKFDQIEEDGRLIADISHIKFMDGQRERLKQLKNYLNH